MSDLKEIGTDTFQQDVLNAGNPVLVDFYAPWCGPCKMLAPVLDKLAGEYAGRVDFLKVNVDDAQDLAVRYRITGVPTLLVFKDGEVVDSIVGMASAAALKTKLDAAADPATP
jgi:thioredoxin 1